MLSRQPLPLGGLSAVVEDGVDPGSGDAESVGDLLGGQGVPGFEDGSFAGAGEGGREVVGDPFGGTGEVAGTVDRGRSAAWASTAGGGEEPP